MPFSQADRSQHSFARDRMLELACKQPFSGLKTPFGRSRYRATIPFTLPESLLGLVYCPPASPLLPISFPSATLHSGQYHSVRRGGIFDKPTQLRWNHSFCYWIIVS